MDAYREEAEALIKVDEKLLLRKINNLVILSFAYFIFLIFASVSISVALGYFIYVTRRLSLTEGVAVVAGINTAFVIIKSFFFKVSFEGHTEIDRKKYPALAKVLSGLEERVGITIDKVFFDTNLNASVVQIPKFGIFGGYKNYVVIGLPLLLLLSKNEFLSILGHEFAHIRTNDSKDSGSVNRIRASWYRLVINIDQAKNVAVKPIFWYLKKYWPKINGYTFAYSRMCEYRADSFAVNYSNKEDLVNALVKIHVAPYYVDLFWDELVKNAIHEINPPKDIFNRMSIFYSKPFPEDKLDEWLKMATFTYTKSEDMHPSLEDRLKAQGVKTSHLELRERVKNNNDEKAGQFLLGKNLQNAIQAFSDTRYNELLPVWSELKKKNDELAEKVKNIDEGKIDPTSLEALQAKVEKDGILASENIINMILQKDPHSTYGLIYRAAFKLKQNSEEGIILANQLILEKKVTYSEMATFIYEYYSKNEMRDEAIELDKAIEKENEYKTKLANDINMLSPKDTFLDPILDQDEIKSILEYTQKEGTKIDTILVCKKVLQTDENVSSHVVGIKCKTISFIKKQEKDVILQSVLNLITSPNVVAFIYDDSTATYFSKMAKISQSQIYPNKSLDYSKNEMSDDTLVATTI